MIRFGFGIVTILAVFALAAITASALAQPAGTGIEGTWQGSISANGFGLRIIFDFKPRGGGAYSGSMESVDQGEQVFNLDSVTYKAGELHCELNLIKAAYDGKLADSGEIQGKWTQNGKSIELNLKRGGKIAVLKRPQEPQRPFPYNEIEVLYDNKAAGTKIGGTLTEPRSKGPFPAVLLITGSGQQNRDEELLGHKPFLVISDYLTRRGIAVLRVDDRGMGKSTGDFNKATTADFATDVECGVAFLKARSEIRHDKIGLIGHSEGGVIAPMVAARNKDVAFIVMLAGTGVDGGKILIEQGALIAKAEGATESAVKFDSDLKQRLFTILAAEKDTAKALVKMNAAIDEDVKKLPQDQRAAETKGMQGGAYVFNSPWMRFFILYDPATALRKLKCPVLVMNGDKDLQVPPKQNLGPIQAALKEGGDKDVTVKLLPGLNHLFQTCTAGQTGSPSEYSHIEETMSPVALKTMGDWIAAHTK